MTIVVKKRVSKKESYAAGFDDCLAKAKKIEQRVASTIEETFGGKAKLTKGKCAWDIEYTDENGEMSRIEVKDDKASLKTGNFFIETNSPRGMSGLALSQESGVEYVAIVSGEMMLIVKLANLMEVVSIKGRRIQSKEGANGNSRGWYGAGYILPIGVVSTIAEHSLPLNN